MVDKLYILNTWCEANDIDEDLTIEMSAINKFSYCESTSTIYYGRCTDEEENRLWRKFVRDLGFIYADKVPVELQAFFHEVGHNETLSMMDDDDWKDRQLMEFAIEKENNQIYKQLLYWNCNIEKEATLWAIDYMTEHYESVMQLAKDLGLA